MVVMPLPVPPMAKKINRFILPVARYAPVWAVIEHNGRKSGKSYRTPVAILRSKGVVRIALPYGRDVDWVKNICAAGEFTILHFGRERKYTAPLVVQDATGKWAPKPARPIMRAMKVEFYLQATEA
jgi:deazaflavin-dependent oxidoreductase (nitroreductase family)